MMKICKSYSKNKRRFLAMLLFIVMLFGSLPIQTAAQTIDETTNHDTRATDPSTRNNWEEYFGEEVGDTTHVGRIWVDKTVLDEDEVKSTAGDSIVRSDPDNFLVGLSAISSYKNIVGQSTIPVDVMLVLDVSGSMRQDPQIIPAMVKETNASINNLLELNVHNRIGVVLYSGNTVAGNSTVSTATLLLELDRYTAPNSEVLTYSTSGSGSNLNYKVNVAQEVKTQSGQSVPVKSVDVTGGTYTQNGISKALEQFALAENVEVNGTKRIPIMVLMSDGAPTAGTTSYTDIGTSHMGNGTTTSSGVAFATQLSAAYTRSQMEQKYERSALVYTLGLGLESLATNDKLIARAVLDPEYSTEILDEYWNTFRDLKAGDTMPIQYFNNASTSRTENLERKENDGIEDIDYVNVYFAANNADDLQNAFENIVEEIIIQSRYYPTQTDDQNVDLSGYLIFEDEIGEYMEVKSMKGMLYDGIVYDGKQFAQNLDDAYDEETGILDMEHNYAYEFVKSVAQRLNITNDQAVKLISNSFLHDQIYYQNADDFSNYITWYSDENGACLGPASFSDKNVPANAVRINQSYMYFGKREASVEGSDLMYIGARVQTNLTTKRQTVRFSIPASLVPMTEYDVFVNNDDLEKADTSVTKRNGVRPARLFYEVGLLEEINERTVNSVVAQDYAYVDRNDIYTFYTNSWAHGEAKTKVTFQPSVENEFYYYPQHTTIYKKDSEGNYDVLDTELNVTGTYYYKRQLFDTQNMEEEMPIVTVYNEIPSELIKFAAKREDGSYYIPKGTPKTDPSAYVTPKSQNNTNTYQNTLKPTVIMDEDLNMIIQVELGNNGMLQLKAEDTGDLVIMKTVSGSAGELDREFAFTVVLDDDTINGQYGELFFTDGRAEFTLKHGEYVTAEDIPAGIGYVVTEEDYGEDGYRTTVTGEEGTIIADGTQIAAFLNEKEEEIEETGDLVIIKTVSGTAGEVERAFAFTVTLDDETVQGQYGDLFFVDGEAEFTLKHGESATAKDLPAGIGYIIAETDYREEGYETTATGTEGTIVADGSQIATFLNVKNEEDPEIPEVGDLVIMKTVTGTAGETNRAFAFTVTLDDETIQGQYGDLFFVDGEAEFTLKHGESATAKDLPAEIGYIVKEEDYREDGYETSTTGGTGVIENEKNAVAAFVNAKEEEVELPEPAVGDMVIVKTVSGTAGEQNRNFAFTVTLSDSSINGSYGDLNFIDGQAEFTLKHGESAIGKDLPAGIGYVVTEADYRTDGYETTATGTTGTITTDSDQVAAFLNVKEEEIPALEAGDLVIVKTVSGATGETDRAFAFTVTLDDETVQGQYGDLTFIDGRAEITLKHGESAVAKGLPGGIGYVVTEADYSSDGYETTATGTEGTIITDGSQIAAFLNSRNEDSETPDPEVGDLVIMKKVSGEQGEKDREFNFMVTLSDDSINGQYGDLNFVDGQAEFTLKHGNHVTARKIPMGVEYTVSEEDYSKEGYQTEAEGTSGTIKDEDYVFVTFVNTKEDPEKPVDPAEPTKPTNPKNPTNPKGTDNSKTSTDGKGTVSLNAAASPKTGDNRNAVIWMVLILLSIVVVYRMYRRRYQD